MENGNKVKKITQNICLRTEKEFIDFLKANARYENRTLSNYVLKILKCNFPDITHKSIKDQVN